MLISCSVFLLMDSTGVALYDSQFPFYYIFKPTSFWLAAACKQKV